MTDTLMAKFDHSYLMPMEYLGVTYASLAHAYYANKITDLNLKWYLIQSTSNKEVDIVSKNFSDFFKETTKEEEDKLINDLLHLKLNKLKEEINYIKEHKRENELPLVVQQYLQKGDSLNEHFN